MRGLVPETPGHCHASAMTDLDRHLTTHDAEDRHICLPEHPGNTRSSQIFRHLPGQYYLVKISVLHSAGTVDAADCPVALHLERNNLAARSAWEGLSFFLHFLELYGIHGSWHCILFVGSMRLIEYSSGART